MARISVCEYRKDLPMSIRGLNSFLASCKMPGDYEIAISRGPFTPLETVQGSKPTFRTDRDTGAAVIIPPYAIRYDELGGDVSAFVVHSSNFKLWNVAPSHSSPALRISLPYSIPPGTLVAMLRAPEHNSRESEVRVITESHGLGLKVSIFYPADLCDGGLSMVPVHPTVFYVEGANFKLDVSGYKSLGTVPRRSDTQVCASVLVEPDTPLTLKVHVSRAHEISGIIYRISYLGSIPGV